MVKKITLCLFIIFFLGACGSPEEQTSGPTLKELEENKQNDKIVPQTEVEISEEETKKQTPKNETSGEANSTEKPETIQQQPSTKDDDEVVINQEEKKEIKAETKEEAKQETKQDNKENEITDENNTSEQKDPPKKNIPKNMIGWDDFFDNGDQTQPSEKFWNLKGSNVVIDGFMGEVLNIGQGWFLLIPSPGAECPFDNGDESYWNKIMIVFVKDKNNLRFTGSQPLRVKGRLDVGVKVDESNYKTMFRLYDATFEIIK